jgi:haloacetate dehalogenase
MSADTPFFGDGFRISRLGLPDASIHFETGGVGPPLLLLHGYPQTHVAWHRVAPALAKHFTLVAPDLRGYGDSTGPHGDSEHSGYSKRTLASDMLALMRSLGFERFAIVGHDRGARVGYRLCMDHPETAACFSSLTVIPTAEMWQRAGMSFGMKAWHWYMFAQPYDLPERLLRSDPEYFLQWTLDGMVQRSGAVTSAAMREYQRAFARESVRHAMMEDYRAAATIDLAHDRDDLAAGRKLQCPTQVLWSASNTAKPSPVEIWQEWATQVEGGAIDCGHLLAEEAPDATLSQLLPFLLRHPGAGGS